MQDTAAWNRSLVSCIIPVFNGAGHLRAAIDSVLGQTYSPIEVIAVDDGSTDHTPEILSAYAGSIQVLRQTNAGPAAARNLGVQSSTGAFVAFLDQDDYWRHDKLIRQMARFDARPELDVVVAHVQSFWQDDHARSADQPRTGTVPGYVSGTMLARRSVFDQVGMFDPGLWFVDSLDWFARAKEHGATVDLVADVLLFHRVHTDNLSRLGRESRAESLRVVRNALSRRQQAEAANARR